MATIPESLKKRGFTHVRSNLKPGQYAGPEIEKAFVFYFGDQLRAALAALHEPENETKLSQD